MKKFSHPKMLSRLLLSLLILGAALAASLVNWPRLPLPRGFNFNEAALAQSGSWVQQTSGVTDTLWSVHFINDNSGWVAGENGALLRTLNGGASWSPVSHCVSGFDGFFSVRFLNSSVGWAGGVGAAAQTGDGGTNFNCGVLDLNAFHNSFFPTSANLAWSVGFYTQPNPPNLNCQFISRITLSGSSLTEENFTVCPGLSLFDVYFADANNGWSVGETGTIVRITNTTSTPPTITPQNSGVTQALWGVYLLDLNTGWAVGDDGTIRKTTNGGTNWSPQNSGTTTDLRDVHFVDLNKGWVVGVGGLILTTTNGGVSWTQESSGVTDALNSVFFSSPNIGYAVGENGVILKRTSAVCPTITVNPANPILPSGVSGQQYIQSFTSTGGVAPFTFTISAGSAPAGLTLASGGTLSGAPAGSGAFNFTVRATDANGCPGERAYTLTINPPCPTITVNPPTLAGGTVGTSYNQTLTATGGAASYSFAVTAGALPAGLTLASNGALTGTPTTANNFTFTVTATDANNCTGSRGYTITIGGATVAGLQYYPLPRPIRLLDTRQGATGCFTPGAPLQTGSTRTQLARTTCDNITIPANAQAVVGNATVVNFQSAGGFITLYPTGAQQPTVSNLNYSANQIIPNAFTVGLGANGQFNIFASAATDFIVDLTGYYAPPGTGGLYYHPLPRPIRLLDTRQGATGCFTPGALLQTGSTRTQLARTTCNGITIPANAQAVVGNATVVNFQSAGGFITLWPNGAQQPTVSNLNYTANQIIPNAFTVGLGANGEFNIFASGATNFIVDITGYFSPDQAADVNGAAGLLYNPLPRPIRLLDTRPQATGCDTPQTPLGGGQTRTELAQVTCDGITIPASARAVVGNGTVVNFISGGGFITLYPTGAQQPTVSNLNYSANQIIPNAFTVGLSAGGQFNIFASGATHFIVDLTGYFAP